MSGWVNVLEQILEAEPVYKEYTEYKDSEIVLDVPLVPSYTDTEPILGEVGTDILATYQPSRSPPTITYDIDKIVYYADTVLYKTIGKGKKLPLYLIMLFRVYFASFVRRHEMFHYLVERGARLVDDGDVDYDDYSQKVYNVRKNSREGNLEEGLADAYASVRCHWLEDIMGIGTIVLRRHPSKYLGHIYIDEKYNYLSQIFSSFTKILKYHFIDCKRPPGYDKAKLFVDEFECLLLRYRHPYFYYRYKYMEWRYRYYYRDRLRYIYYYPDSIVIVMHTFKGLSWLFEELSEREPRDFSDYNQPADIPYSFDSFLIFLENIIHDDDPLLGMILPFPNEIPKK